MRKKYLAFVLLSLLPLGFWCACAPFSGPRQVGTQLFTDADLQTPHIIRGTPGISKQEFYHNQDSSFITDIAAGELDGSPGVDVVITKMKSAVFLDGNGQPKREIAYTCPTLPKNQNQKLSFWKVKVADIEKDGVCEFWAADTGKEYTLLDNQGKLLFCNCDKNNQLKPDALKKRLLATTSITTGDLDGDGKQELIGFGGDRLRAFNGKGEMVIDQDVTPNATVNLRAFDTNGDGKDEILYARGGVSFLDSKGQNEKRLTRPEWASGSLLESGETPKTLVFAKNRLNLLDYNGNLSASYEAPYLIEGKKWQEIVIADALKVRFYSNQPKCLAVLADLTEVDKSLLYIYAPDGKLMYQELLSMDRIRNLEFHAAALPKDDGAESLLLVSGDTVLQYTIK